MARHDSGVSGWSTGTSGPSSAQSPLDELFIAGATIAEPSAAERRRAGRARAGGGPGEWLERHRAVAIWLVVLALTVASSAFSLETRAQLNMPDRLVLFVAVPADGNADFGMVDAAEHEAALAVDWIEQQTSRRFRGDIGFGYVTDLTMPEADLRGDSTRAYNAIMAEVTSRTDDRSVFPIVMADVRTETLDHGIQTCGQGGPLGVVVFLGNCPGFEPTRSARWGSPASFTLAHELVHGLGAVADCAPNESGTGHVSDDPSDVLYTGPITRRPSDPVTLDAARDDYFEHANSGCPDIADSPLWEDG